MGKAHLLLIFVNNNFLDSMHLSNYPHLILILSADTETGNLSDMKEMHFMRVWALCIMYK